MTSSKIASKIVPVLLAATVVVATVSAGIGGALRRPPRDQRGKPEGSGR